MLNRSTTISISPRHLPWRGHGFALQPDRPLVYFDCSGSVIIESSLSSPFQYQEKFVVNSYLLSVCDNIKECLLLSVQFPLIL